MSYGPGRPTDYDKIDSFNYRLWFESIFDFIGSKITILNTTASITVKAQYYYVRADATAGAITISLPTALTCAGREIIIKKIDASVNAVTVSKSGTDVIEGGTTSSLAAQWDTVKVISNGNTGWEIV